MKSLTQIETGVQFNAANERLSLTTDDNLEVVNRNYRTLAGELPWPELRRRNTSLSSTAETAAIDMPNRAIVVFLDLKLVEIQDAEDENNYKVIPPAPTEMRFANAANQASMAVPEYYVLDNDDVDDQIRFAPAPKYGGQTVRLTGIIEPEPLVDGDDTTVFRQRAADDALEHIIAADLFFRDGMLNRAAGQLSKAQQVLGRLFGKDVVPLERLQQIIQG